MASYSLITQATYQEIQFALYKNEELLQQGSIKKTEASSLLMDQLNKLLKKHSVNWNNIDYIGVNQGPAPFTTLRALITTVNGIGFATKIGLVGVDGLTSFVTEQHKKALTVVLLNAFAQDVYFAVQNDASIKTGWANGQEFLEQLKADHPNQTITFVGNGVPLHRQAITELFGDNTQIAQKCPEYVSLQTIAQQCFGQDIKVPHLTPLYLKTHKYKPSH
jgi:tRNA threonylcarbamoyladenosine biosynthesis protein TsaB